MKDTAADELLYEVKGAAGVVTFNRPAAHNALTFTMYDRLGEIWHETQAESLGPSLRLDDDYRALWSYIPHFIHVPFYVYAYAFGDCLVNSLYAVYQDASPGFAEKYLDMLKAGGTKRHKELLAPFGLDAADPAFWSRGLGVIGGFIDELERT